MGVVEDVERGVHVLAADEIGDVSGLAGRDSREIVVCFEIRHVCQY